MDLIAVYLVFCSAGQNKKVERRKSERFEFPVHSKIDYIDPQGVRRALNVTARNLSDQGALFTCDQPLPVGTRLRIEMTLTFKRMLGMDGAHGRVLVRTQGRITRSTLEGLAVEFEKSCAMIPLS